jgi:hypothetical protein
VCVCVCVCACVSVVTEHIIPRRDNNYTWTVRDKQRSKFVRPFNKLQTARTTRAIEGGHCIFVRVVISVSKKSSLTRFRINFPLSKNVSKLCEVGFVGM